MIYAKFKEYSSLIKYKLVFRTNEKRHFLFEDINNTLFDTSWVRYLLVKCFVKNVGVSDGPMAAKMFSNNEFI